MAFKFNAAANGNVDIEITGVIGDTWWSDSPCTSDMVRAELKKVPNASLIRVFVDTDGGDVWHGMGIYQALVEHPAKVEVTVGARAQSCGSLVMMAGDTIIMPEMAKLCVHNPWTIFKGTAAGLEARAKDLRNLEDSFVAAYVARTGMSESDMRALMNEDRLMSAKEALERGFCTELRKPKQKVAAMSDNDLTLARHELQALATQRAIAAQANKQPTQTPAPNAPAETENKKDMAQLAVILAALCLAEGISDAEATAHINALKGAKDANGKLLEAVGSTTVDGALGAIKGFKEKAEQYDALAAEREQEKANALAAKKASLITQASVPATGTKADASNPHAGKLVPAQKAWAEGVSLETLEGWLASAPIVLRGDGLKPPTTVNGGYAGKTYDQMSNRERAECKANDPELFKTLRAEAHQKGLL